MPTPTSETKASLRAGQSKLTSVHEMLSNLLSAVGNNTFAVHWAEQLGQAVPWATFVDAAAETLPMVKFVLALLGKWLEEPDPNRLAYVACTLSYQRALQQALPDLLDGILLPPLRKDLSLRARPQTEAEYDFSQFTLAGAHSHPFMVDANRSLDQFCQLLGVDSDTATQLTVSVQERFLTNLCGLLAHGRTRQHFTPLRDWLSLNRDAPQLEGALRAHANLQRQRFEEPSALSGLALRDVYVDLDCTVMPWSELRGQKTDPFGAQPVRPLLDAVHALFQDPQYRDAIVVQGPAGSGKSSFTLRLCADLLARGLSPIRVELKHLHTDTHVAFGEAIPKAIQLTHGESQEARFLPQSESYEREFLRLLEREVSYRGMQVCPFVLVLDGWDELPLAGDQNYLARVDLFLSKLKEATLRRRGAPVRVVLVGRPSEAIEGFLSETTRLVSVLPWSGDKLSTFLERQASAYAARGADRPAPLPSPAILQKLIALRNTGRLDVLGSPLLVQLCLRTLSGAHESEPPAGQHATSDEASPVGASEERVLHELEHDPTSLYQRLTDRVIAKAGKSHEVDYRPEEGAKLHGDNLRDMLQRTAEAMTVLGQENLPREELEVRLELSSEQFEDRMAALDGQEKLSRLMISFFFKGGHRHLGCEFAHKSFREYLFAERTLSVLKSYGRATAAIAPTARAERELWQDFEEQDPRSALTHDLAEMYGPRWIAPEVLEHVYGLLQLEIKQAAVVDSSGTADHPQHPLALWLRVGAGLRDLWDYWAYKGHQRPQYRTQRRSRETEWEEPLAVRIAKRSGFRSRHPVQGVPHSTTSLDAHLGVALLQFCAMVYAALAPYTNGQRFTLAREASPHALAKDNLLMRGRRHYGRLYLFRILAAGYRPRRGLFLQHVDLSHSELHGADLQRADLRHANLQGANLRGADLRGANLTAAQLTQAELQGCDLSNADLRDAQLQGCDLRSCLLVGARLQGADLAGARIDPQALAQTDRVRPTTAQ